MERCRKSLFRHCCCLKVSFPKLGSKMKMVMLQGRGEHNENKLKFDVSLHLVNASGRMHLVL